MSDGGFINTADIVPHHDDGFDQIVVDEADFSDDISHDFVVTDHDAIKNSDDVQIRDILEFVHDHSKISNNFKPRGLHKLYIRSLERKTRKNTLGGMFFIVGSSSTTSPANF